MRHVKSKPGGRRWHGFSQAEPAFEALEGRLHCSVGNLVADPRGVVALENMQGIVLNSGAREFYFTPQRNTTTAVPAVLRIPSGLNITTDQVWIEAVSGGTRMYGTPNFTVGPTEFRFTNLRAGVEYRVVFNSTAWVGTTLHFELPAPQARTLTANAAGDVTTQWEALRSASDTRYFRYIATTSGPVSIEADTRNNWNAAYLTWDTDMRVFRREGANWVEVSGPRDNSDATWSGMASAGDEFLIAVSRNITERSGGESRFDLIINGPGLPRIDSISATRTSAYAGATVQLRAQSGTNEPVSGVMFYLDDGDGVWEQSQDMPIGATAGLNRTWTATMSMPHLFGQIPGNGVARFFAVAFNQHGGAGTPRSTTMTFVNRAPTVGALDAAAGTYRPGDSVGVGITPWGTYDADGEVREARFYHDRNNNGRADGGEALLRVAQGASMFNTSVVIPTSFAGGNFRIVAVVVDDAGRTSQGVWAQFTVLPPFRAPTLSGVSLQSTTVRVGDTATVRIGNVTDPDDDATIVRAFWDQDRNGIFDPLIDLEVATAAPGANLRLSRVIPADFDFGQHRVFVFAEDARGLRSAVTRLTLTVPSSNRPPVLDGVFVGPSPILPGSQFQVQAYGVRDSDVGSVNNVTYYFDSNGDGVLQTGSGGDTRMGAATAATDWALTVSAAASMAPGAYLAWAVPQDQQAARGAAVPFWITIGQAPPPSSNDLLSWQYNAANPGAGRATGANAGSNPTAFVGVVERTLTLPTALTSVSISVVATINGITWNRVTPTAYESIWSIGVSGSTPFLDLIAVRSGTGYTLMMNGTATGQIAIPGLALGFGVQRHYRVDLHQGAVTVWVDGHVACSGAGVSQPVLAAGNYSVLLGAHRWSGGQRSALAANFEQFSVAIL